MLVHLLMSPLCARLTSCLNGKSLLTQAPGGVLGRCGRQLRVTQSYRLSGSTTPWGREAQHLLAGQLVKVAAGRQLALEARLQEVVGVGLHGVRDGLGDLGDGSANPLG